MSEEPRWDRHAERESFVPRDVPHRNLRERTTRHDNRGIGPYATPRSPAAPRRPRDTDRSTARPPASLSWDEEPGERARHESPDASYGDKSQREDSQSDEDMEDMETDQMLELESAQLRRDLSAQRARAQAAEGRLAEYRTRAHAAEDQRDEYRLRAHSAEEQLARAKAQLAAVHASMRKQEQEHREANAVSERRLAATANDLANLRNLGGESVDEQDLRTLFDDINDAVADAAFSLVDSLALEEPSFQAVHSQRLKDGAAVLFDWECILGQARTFWRHAVHNQRDVEETFVLVAQNVVMLGLGDFILVPFNREHEFATALVGFEAQIQAEQPQEFSARWRSITYKAMAAERDDESLVISFADFVADGLREFVVTVLDSPYLARHPAFGKFHEDLRAIGTRALKWQDDARMMHHSFDFSPFLPSPKTIFADDQMEFHETAGSQELSTPSLRVLLPVAMGMTASRTDTRSAVYSRSTVIRKKAKVVVQ